MEMLLKRTALAMFLMPLSGLAQSIAIGNGGSVTVGQPPNSSILGVQANIGITGGGSVGVVPVAIDTAIVPLLGTPNTFTEPLTVLGAVNATSYELNGATILGSGLLGAHGSPSGNYVQLSDGTGANGNIAKFGSGGIITDSGVPCCGGGGGTPAFGSITGGTNTAATMVVGSGASLAPTGSGTVTANAIAGTPNVAAANLSSSGTVTFTGIEPVTTSLLEIASNGSLSTIPIPSASGTVNSGTATYFGYYATSSTAISPDANWLDNGSGLVAAEPITINDGTGTGGNMSATEGTAPTAASGSDTFWADSTAHRLKMNNNNGGAQIVLGASSAATAGNLLKAASNGYDPADTGIAAGNVLVAGQRQITGYSPGVITSSATKSIGNFGGSQGNFTQGITAGAMPLMAVATTVTGMYISCGITGINSSSGVFTMYKQAAGSSSLVGQTMTVTYGTTTANTMLSDTTHTFSVAAGDRIGIQVTSQASETLGDCAATVTY